MNPGIPSFIVSRNRSSRLASRIAFLLFFSLTVITGLLTHKESLPIASGRTQGKRGGVHCGADPMGRGGSLKLVVRDSMTGFALPSEVVSQVKNGAGSLWTNAKGQGNYQLTSGLNDLEIQAVDHKYLRTHFEPDLQPV